MATKKYTGVEPQREPGVFKLRIRVRNRRTGQRINTDRHFRGTLRQAVAERSRLMREFAQGEEEVRYSRTTLGVYARSWISRRKAEGAKPSTLENRVDVLNRHILPDFGDHYVDAVGRADVLAWREQAKERIGLRTKRRVAPATVNGWVRVLQALVASYYADNGLGPSPLTRIRALREPSRRKDDPNTLAPDLLPVVLDKFEQLYPQHYALLFIGLSTGMRWSELSALEWDDIDEEAGIIRSVRGQVRKRVGTRKVDDEVDFPLLPEMLEVLRRHRRRLVEEQSPKQGSGVNRAYPPKWRNTWRKRKQGVTACAADLRLEPTLDWRAPGVGWPPRTDRSADPDLHAMTRLGPVVRCDNQPAIRGDDPRPPCASIGIPHRGARR